jgi:hypothetical protein
VRGYIHSLDSLGRELARAIDTDDLTVLRLVLEKIQENLNELDRDVREGFLALESALGGDFIRDDEAETVRSLREAQEALPDREEVLRLEQEALFC